MTYTLITGATAGIGRALAKEFAKRGHQLILASRNLVKMQDIKQDLETSYRTKVICVETDLSRLAAPEDLYACCQQNQWPVNVLVNNAGIGLEAKAQVDQSLEDTERLLRLNIEAVLKLSMLFGREMRGRRNGYILNIASTAAFQPLPYAAVYGAAKAFVLSLSEAMHIELGADGVGVTAVCPGLTDTDFFKHGKPNIPGWLYKLITPELVARRAVRALYRRKIYVIPYFQHWLIAQLSRFFTRSAVARIMRHIGKTRQRIYACHQAPAGPIAG